MRLLLLGRSGLKPPKRALVADAPLLVAFAEKDVAGGVSCLRVARHIGPMNPTRVWWEKHASRVGTPSSARPDDTDIASLYACGY
jgi:hypothetical protein